MKAPKNIVRQVLFFGPLLVVIFFLLWWLGGVSGPLHYRREQLSPEEKISQNIEGLVKRNLTSKKQLQEFRLSLLPKPLTQLPNPQTDSSAENLLSYARNLSLVLRPLASERPSELGTVAEILEAGGQGWEKGNGSEQGDVAGLHQRHCSKGHHAVFLLRWRKDPGDRR